MKPHDYVILEIARERERQMSVEGWTVKHDDRHRGRQLALAAACYVLHPNVIQLPESNAGRLHGDDDSMARGGGGEGSAVSALWPWDWKWWKPKTYRHNLIRAAALLVAEIERLDRRAAAKAPLP